MPWCFMICTDFFSEEPMEQSKTPLLIFLLEMMPSFVRAKNPHYPIKKVWTFCSQKYFYKGFHRFSPSISIDPFAFLESFTRNPWRN